MATITGSTTIDWSSISLDSTVIEQSLNEASIRFETLSNEDAVITFFSPTQITVQFPISGGTGNLFGFGFDTDFPVITAFNYSNPTTGDVLSLTGNFDFIGNEFINRMTFGFPGFRATFIGNIVVDQLGNTLGATFTQIGITLGSTQVTIKGSLVGDANSNISGNITQISVLSGTNTIVMSGLSLPFTALDSVTTVNDLFSAVGSQLPGNDTITYTNNSVVGMTFFGGAGNDTITISGPNADTLNGGDGNDILIGGLGQDTVNGGAGDDQITMLVTAGNVDTIDAGDDTDTLVLSGIVPGDHVVVIDLSAADQIVSVGGVADALTQSNLENVNAVGIGSSITVTGNDGDNIIIGSKGNDSIDGGAGNDTIIGGVGADTLLGSADNDLFLLASTGEYAGGEIIDGGLGTDTLRYTGNAATTLTLTNLVTNLEQVEIANVAVIGLAAINVNAAAVTSNGMTLVGNNGANVLTGTSQTDTLTGNDGNDVFLIGAAADHGGGEVITGGAGTDVIRFTSTTAGQSLVLAAGVTTVESVVIGTAAGVTTGTTALDVDASAVGNGLTLIGNAGANTLMGTGLNDVLKGGAGNDRLDGGLGTNLLIGGTGNDSYVVNAPTDVVSEGLAAGTDTVVASFNYTLGANVENLELLTGNANLNGTGNTLANVLTGNDGSNVLNGGVGNDTLVGGLGEDTVNGGTENDRIVMQVTAGDVDVADGGAGLDTLALVGAVDGDGVVVVNLASLTDQVTKIGTVNPELLVQKNFENLDASGLGSSVTATGSAGANFLIGSDGADTLDGAAGNDTLAGGTGDDTLTGGDGNDTFLFGSGDGQDLVQDNSGSADKILFAGGINPLDLVISRQADDLRLAIHGSSDQITVQNWFASPANRTETIQAGNGETLLSTQVDQLIQAMAGFTQQSGLTWDQAIDQQPQQVQTILAANWQ